MALDQAFPFNACFLEFVAASYPVMIGVPAVDFLITSDRNIFFPSDQCCLIFASIPALSSYELAKLDFPFPSA
jgi:hypothetical protein